MKRSALVLVVLSLFASPACKKKSSDPPPDPNAIHHCSIEDAKVVGKNLELARINIGGENLNKLRLDGKLVIDVQHKTTEYGATPKRVCGGSVQLTAASYDATGAAKATIPIDGTCAPAPSGQVLSIRPAFTPAGKTGPFAEFICTFVADIPKELGGTGQSVGEQEARVGWQKLAKDEPKVAGPILAYVDATPKIVTALGDWTRDRPTSTCAATVKGPATVFTYRELRQVAANAKGGQPIAEVDEPHTPGGLQLEGDKLAVDLAQAINSSPREYVVGSKRVDELSKTIPSAPRYVVVLMTRSYQMPQITESAAKDKTGAYKPGSYFGNVAVVDRQTGALACASPFSATSIAAKTDNPGRDLIGAVSAMAWQAVAKIAPGLSH